MNQQAVLNERIDTFIMKNHGISDSEEFNRIKESADRSANHGFSSASNVRYAQFLEAFKESPELQERYKDAYPNSSFLPWAAFHKVLKSLNLWVDLPKHYLGAVPSEQIQWLDLFDFKKKDAVKEDDLIALIQTKKGTKSAEAINLALNPSKKATESNELPLFMDPVFDTRRDMMRLMDSERSMIIEHGQRHRLPSFAIDEEIRRMERNVQERFAMDSRGFDRRIMSPRGFTTPAPSKTILESIEAVKASFFVVAPPDAFGVKKDFITRFKEDIKESIKPKTPPNDPLVIRFVKGGCIIVAAWGDEAAHINEIAKELNI